MIPGYPLIVTGLFALLVALTLAGALIAVLSTRIIRSVTGLALCCIGIAGLYAFLDSPFLALMEILIYVGAVCVTIVFGVMLSEPDEPDPREFRGRELGWGIVALLVCGAVFGAVCYLGCVCLPHLAAVRPGSPAADGSVPAIGVALLTTYSLPFEMISLLLLVAILGALVIAHGGRGKQ